MSTTETKKAAVALSGELVELANEIRAKQTIDAEGVATAPEGLFAELLPKIDAELPLETIERSQRALSTYGTALFLATGENAVEHTKANTDIKRVSGVFKAGLDEVAINYNVPSGVKADGTKKDPATSLIHRRYEHPEHAEVRQHIYDRTRGLAD